MLWYGHPSHVNPDQMPWKIPRNGLMTHGIRYKAFLDIMSGISLWNHLFFCWGWCPKQVSKGKSHFAWYDIQIFGTSPCLGWSIAMFDYRSWYQPSLRLGLPNHRRDAIGLHGSLEQGLINGPGEKFCVETPKLRRSCFFVSSFRWFNPDDSGSIILNPDVLSVIPISVDQIMSNLYVLSVFPNSATMFS